MRAIAETWPKAICKACREEIPSRGGRLYCWSCEYLRERKKRDAHQVIAKATKDGLLPKLDGAIQCVDCGDTAQHYDHRDYDYPLNAEPVCRSCNRKRGEGVNSFYVEDLKNIKIKKIDKSIYTHYGYVFNLDNCEKHRQRFRSTKSYWITPHGTKFRKKDGSIADGNRRYGLMLCTIRKNPTKLLRN
jgi:hypothetical protein